METQETQEQPTGIKMRDVDFESSKIDFIRQHPVMRDNMTSAIMDFETLYASTLDAHFQLTKEQVAQIKTDLFQAFCYGCLVGTDQNSNYRKRFKVPKELEPKPKSQIITGDEQLVKPNSGIILP